MKILFYFLVFYALIYLYGLALLAQIPGSLTQLARVLIPVSCIIMLLASPFVLGWWAMLLLVVLTLFLLPVLRGLAAKHASKIFGYNVGFGHIGPWEEFGESLGAGKIPSGQLLSESNKAWEHREKILNEIEKRREIQEILKQNGISGKDFRELYKTLMGNALDDLAWDILGNPQKLKKLIDLCKSNSSPKEIFGTFRGWGIPVHKSDSVVEDSEPLPDTIWCASSDKLLQKKWIPEEKMRALVSGDFQGEFSILLAKGPWEGVQKSYVKAPYAPGGTLYSVYHERNNLLGMYLVEKDEWEKFSEA